jgi:hypothetical protein
MKPIESHSIHGNTGQTCVDQNRSAPIGQLIAFPCFYPLLNFSSRVTELLLFFEETGGAVQPLLKSFIKKKNSNRADYKELTEFKTKEQSILTLRRLMRQRKKQKR